MGDESQQEIIKEVCDQLETSQELVEKAAFDAINQQDKVIQMMCASMAHITGLLSKVEMIGLESDDFLDIGEFSNMYQRMMEEQDVLSEVIHGMEYEIASHRNSMELATELLLKDL